MHTIAEQLSQIQHTIESISQQAGRASNSTELLAVSKTQPASRIEQAYLAGQRAFGENYLQEAREKQEALAALDISWHFIGPIQSNKTREIAEHFDWVHSVDRLKIAKRLSEQRPQTMAPLNICLQVNIDNEPTKAGASIEALPELVLAINNLPRLCLRGLMVIPEKRDNYDEQLAVFQRVKALQQQLLDKHPELRLDTLSMGMSADMTAAISAGATIVRIGSALFGARQ